MNKRIEKEITKIYNKVFKKIFTNEVVKEFSQGSIDQIQQRILKLQSSEQYDKFCMEFSKELAKHGLSNQKGIWRKYYQAAKKIHYIALPKTFNEFELNTMKEAVQNNFKMIKSIPERIMEITNQKFTNTLIQEVIQGKKPRGYFKKELEKHGAIHAGLIARTETAKLQTSILQNRSTNLGSVAYIWLASNDKRTRPSHRNMNGVVVLWNHEKPLLDNMRGHAGEFPNCRCSPEPILDIKELNKSYYKVYNYHTDKIDTYSKRQLIEILNNDEI